MQVESKFIDGKVKVVLQHGKQTDHQFACDYGYPFCALQAFAVALALHSI